MHKKKDDHVSLPLIGVPKLLPYVRGYGKIIFSMIVFCILGSAMDILQPVFQRYALNHFVGEKTLDTLPLYLLIYIGLLVIVAGFNYIATYRAMKVEVSINRDLRRQAWTDPV